MGGIRGPSRRGREQHDRGLTLRLCTDRLRPHPGGLRPALPVGRGRPRHRLRGGLKAAAKAVAGATARTVTVADAGRPGAAKITAVESGRSEPG